MRDLMKSAVAAAVAVMVAAVKKRLEVLVVVGV